MDNVWYRTTYYLVSWVTLPGRFILLLLTLLVTSFIISNLTGHCGIYHAWSFKVNGQTNGQQSHHVVDQGDASLGDIHWALLLWKQQSLEKAVHHCDGAVQQHPTSPLHRVAPKLTWIRQIRYSKIELGSRYLKCGLGFQNGHSEYFLQFHDCFEGKIHRWQIAKRKLSFHCPDTDTLPIRCWKLPNVHERTWPPKLCEFHTPIAFWSWVALHHLP